MSQRTLLNLGVIGLPADWDSRYATALGRLQGRVRITTLFDPVPARAEEAAETLSARASAGIRSTLLSRGVNATLLLKTGWQGNWTIQAAVAAAHPCFLGRDILRSMPTWNHFASTNRFEGIIAVPECLLRYQPSLLRLRELMATQLGHARRVWFSLPRARQQVDADLSLRDVTNWCRSTFEIVMPSITLEAVDTTGESHAAAIQATTSAGIAVQLEIEWMNGSADRGPDPENIETEPYCRIVCDAGDVDLLGPRNLRWHLTGGDTTSEELAADRSATDVALDLFARRAVGGLIPVPCLSDLVHAQQMADEIAAPAS